MNNDLIKFYIWAEDCQLIDRQHFETFNQIKCLNLVSFSNNYNIIGVTKQGEWFAKTNREYFVLDADDKIYKIISIVENPFIQIEEDICKRFRPIMNDFDVKIIFPFNEIVEYIFTNVPSLYWFELAYLWFENLHISQKKKLILILEERISNKNLPQNLRHKIRKDINNIKKQK